MLKKSQALIILTCDSIIQIFVCLENAYTNREIFYYFINN